MQSLKPMHHRIAASILLAVAKASTTPGRLAETIAYLEPKGAHTDISVLMGGRINRDKSYDVAEGMVSVRVDAALVNEPVYTPAKPLLDALKKGGLELSFEHGWSRGRFDAKRYGFDQAVVASSTWFAPFDPITNREAPKNADTTQTFVFGAEAFRRAMQRAVHSMADEDIRYYLRGALIQATTEKSKDASLVTTDGHRLTEVALAMRRGSHPKATHGQGEFIIPRESVLSIVRLMGKKPIADERVTVKVRQMGDYAVIDFHTGARAVVKCIDGKFPDWKRVMLDTNDSQRYYRALIESPAVLANAIKDATDQAQRSFEAYHEEDTRPPTFGDKWAGSDHLIINGRSLSVKRTHRDQDPAVARIEAQRVEVPIASTLGTETVEVGFQPPYLSQACETLGELPASLYFSKKSPGLGTYAFSQGELTLVVMPCRL